MANKTTAQIRADRANAGRIGAYVTHSRHDVRETTKAGRQAFLQRFIDEVDPDRTLPEAERTRRAESAKKAYFMRLAMKSAQARRSKSGRGRN